MINYPRRDREGWKRWIPSWKLVLGTIFTGGMLLVAAALALFVYAWVTIDIPEQNEVAAAQTSIIYWNDGKTEMARIGDTNRISIPLSQVPMDVQHAVISAEDRKFYQHSGFDVTGFARALWSNITKGTSQGGSTITQQYAKNAYLNAEKTFDRKFRELVLSLKLETQLSKDEILERYLNTIYFGRGSYGIQTASEAYFGVDAKELTLEQAAVLASIINAPGAFSPEENMDRLKNRYRYVLDGMVEMGFISPSERDDAVENFPDIKDRKTGQRYAGTTGYLISMVEKEVLSKGFTETELYGGGLRIVSTFSKAAQAAAVQAVADQGPKSNTEGLRIGLASVEPVTGEVVAIYGGEDYLKNSLNNATQAIGQAGSTFKPFALVAANDAGISPYSTWPGNSPTTTQGYTYQNYGNTSYGSAVTLLYGTEQSINSVFVSLEAKVGVAPVRQAALNAGIPEDTNGWAESNNLTFVLGTASPHPIDVATAYATFAARGQRAQTTALRRIEDERGGVLYKRESTAVSVIDANNADVVNWYLQNVVNNGTGRPARALGRPAAGKTGSTDSYKSSWFAGHTPQLATAVMFIKEDKNGNPISLNGTGGMSRFYGGGFPARVWTAYMRGALQGQPVEQFQQPASMPGGGSAGIPGSGKPTASNFEGGSPSPTGTSQATESGTPTKTADKSPTNTAEPTQTTSKPRPTSGATTPPPTQKPTKSPTQKPTKEPTKEPPTEADPDPTEDGDPDAAGVDAVDVDPVDVDPVEVDAGR